MDTVKIGLIGIGAVANSEHIPAFLQDKRASVTALCDIDRKRVATAKKKFFKNAAIYEDYMDLLADDSVELVDILAPNFLHAEIAAEAFRAGKSVILETPDAVNVEGLEKIIAASLGAQKDLFVLRPLRFDANIQYLKKLIDKSRLGEVYSLRLVNRKRRSVPGGDGSWYTSKELSGGGALMDLGFPMLDLAWYLLGCPEPDIVSCNTFREISKLPDENGEFDVEDTAIGTIKFKSGTVAQFEFAWCSNVERDAEYIRVGGSMAGAYWDGSKDIICGESTKGKKKVHYVNQNDIIPETTLNLTHILDVVLGKAQPAISAKEGLEVLKIMTALYESAANGGVQVQFA